MWDVGLAYLPSLEAEPNTPNKSDVSPDALPLVSPATIALPIARCGSQERRLWRIFLRAVPLPGRLAGLYIVEVEHITPPCRAWILDLLPALLQWLGPPLVPITVNAITLSRSGHIRATRAPAVHIVVVVVAQSIIDSAQ